MVGRTVLTVVLALGSGVGLSDPLLAESLPGPVKWGLTTDGLRMAIYPASSGPVPATGAEFYVAFQNVGESHFILNLGTMFGNAKLMLPLHVRLIVTDSTGRTRELKNHGTQRGLRAGGRMDDFVVALPVGSTYTLRLNIDDYWSWSPPTAEFGLKQAVGKHRIQAVFDGRDIQASRSFALLPFWKGSVESNVFEFNVAKNRTPAPPR